MRHIKFRSWNVEQKIMHDIAFPSWNGCHEVWENNIPQSKVIYLTNGAENEGILMDYIGLKDIIGNEVYRDDIVTHSHYPNDVVLIKFDNDTLAYVGIVYSQGVECNTVLLTIGDSERIKIIGNIHANPELLNS